MAPGSQFTMRWVLTHEPLALFEAAARSFQHLVRERTSGAVDVVVSTPTEHGEGVRPDPLAVAREVARGDIEMSQTYTTVLGKLHDPMWALDLPFLFRSHEHASAVLDGRIGRELLGGLEAAGLRGLSFTYSGGYRIISTVDRAIRGVEDLRGLRIRTSDNPVVTALFEELGATPVPAPLWKIPEMTEAGRIDAAESTWPRYWDMEHFRAQAVVNETSHSLFLTAIVVNQRFFAALPDRHQAVLADTALEVGAIERAKSVADGAAARATHVASGGAVHQLSAAASERFSAVTRGVRDRLAVRFGADLVERIAGSAWSAAG